MYLRGQGVPQNHRKAAMWFEKASEKGYVNPLKKNNSHSKKSSKSFIQEIFNYKFFQNLDAMSRIAGSNQDTFDENMAYSNYVDAQNSEEKEYWYSKYSELREERLRREQDRKDDLRHFELLDAIRNRN